MLRPSPNHGTQRLPNDDDDDEYLVRRIYNNGEIYVMTLSIHIEGTIIKTNTQDGNLLGQGFSGRGIRMRRPVCIKT